MRRRYPLLLKRPDVVSVAWRGMGRKLLLPGGMIRKEFGYFVAGNELGRIGTLVKLLVIIDLILIVASAPDVLHGAEEAALVLFVLSLGVELGLEVASLDVSAFRSTYESVALILIIEHAYVLAMIFLVETICMHIYHLLRAIGRHWVLTLHGASHGHARV